VAKKMRVTRRAAPRRSALTSLTHGGEVSARCGEFVVRDEPGLTMETTVYVKAKHVAARTSHFVFNQLIPYIGNKRKLLDLIQSALGHTRAVAGSTFVDLFAGSGVVSRLAKTQGFRVICNDWEPYTKVITNQSIKYLTLGVGVV
jgi:hypothetical protein